MEFYPNSKTIMLARGFNFEKWVTNDPVLQEYFNKNETMQNNFQETGDDALFTKSQFSCAKIKFKRVLVVD